MFMPQSVIVHNQKIPLLLFPKCFTNYVVASYVMGYWVLCIQNDHLEVHLKIIKI